MLRRSRGSDSVLTLYSNRVALIPLKNEATARAWIDAFFFRASAMMAPDARMIVDMEHAIPATTVSPSSLATLSGYVAMVTTSRNARKSDPTYPRSVTYCFV